MVPESHDGSRSFDVVLRFSDQIFPLTFQHSQTPSTQSWKREQIREIVRVKEGSITNVRAVNTRRTDAWHINVKPNSDDPVIVFARPIADCEHRRAACTADGRPLTNRPQISVGGPVYIRIADASAVEAPGATLDFEVRLVDRLTERELINSSSFSWTRGSPEEGFSTLWGQSALSSFDGGEDSRKTSSHHIFS